MYYIMPSQFTAYQNQWMLGHRPSEIVISKVTSQANCPILTFHDYPYVFSLCLASCQMNKLCWFNLQSSNLALDRGKGSGHCGGHQQQRPLLGTTDYRQQTQSINLDSVIMCLVACSHERFPSTSAVLRPIRRKPWRF